MPPQHLATPPAKSAQEKVLPAEIALTPELKVETFTDDFEKRMILWGYALAGILTAVHVSEDLSPSEAEVALALALSIWGISEGKAKKLMSKKLVFAPVNQKKIV